MSTDTNVETTETETATADATTEVLPEGVERVWFEGEMLNAYGTKLANPIKYRTSYLKYLTHAAMVAAKDEPKEKEIVEFVNATNKANERQKGMLAALNLAGIKKPTLENDDQLKLREMAKIFESAGSSKSVAREKAANALGLKWAE
jgi:hypothetical protein